jgi:membrane protein
VVRGGSLPRASQSPYDRRGLVVNISPRATGGLASESNEQTRLFPMAASQLSTAQQLESIWKLGGLTPKQLAREVIHRVYEDNLLGRASELAYSFVLAIFPGMLFLLSLLGFFASHAVTLRESLLGYFADFLPPAAYQIFAHTLDEAAKNASGDKITLGLFLSLWFAAGGMTSMISTLNEAYHVHDNRSFLKVRAIAVGLTTVISFLTLSALVLVMIGSHLAEMLGELLHLRHAIVLAWQFLHWPLAAFFLVLAFSLIYYYAPDLKEQHWYWITPGSLVGVLLWLAASGLLRGYLHFFNSYSRTYGSLGAVIILLLWLYVTALAFLIGGEINAIIEQAAAERGHPEAKAAGQKAA